MKYTPQHYHSTTSRGLLTVTRKKTPQAFHRRPRNSSALASLSECVICMKLYDLYLIEIRKQRFYRDFLRIYATFYIDVIDVIDLS